MRWRDALLLAGALVLSLLCKWILIPPANAVQIIATVAAIELSPYLLAFNGLLLFAGLLYRSRMTPAVVLVAGVNMLLCALPLATMWAAHTPVIPDGAGREHVVLRTIAVKLGAQRATVLAYLPQTNKPAPVVFAIYGGAWQRGSSSNDSALNGQLAGEGYAVFALEYRHAPRYRFPVALGDVRSEMSLILHDALAYHIDPQRVAVLGHSSGGELAELVAFERGSPVRALISYSGAIDLIKGYYIPPQPDPIGVRSVISDYLGGPPASAPQAYRAASPIMQIRRGLPPTLLIYGARDHVVDVRYARRFRDDLRAQGATVMFLELPWTEHSFESVPFGLHAPAAARATHAFLSAYL